MKKQLLATLIGMGFSIVAVAQDGAAQPQAPQDKDALAVLPEFKAVDANKDGMIDADEASALTKTLQEEHQIQFQFETVDTDRDGVINDREYVAYDHMLKQRLGIS